VLKREVVDYIVSHHELNMRRACRLMKQSRSVQYYRSIKDPKQALRGRMREIAKTRVRYGYRHIHVLLKREGWQLGKNQMYRLIARATAASLETAQAAQDGRDTPGKDQADQTQ
jgi:putative transposase